MKDNLNPIKLNFKNGVKNKITNENINEEKKKSKRVKKKSGLSEEFPENFNCKLIYF